MAHRSRRQRIVSVCGSVALSLAFIFFVVTKINPELLEEEDQLPPIPLVNRVTEQITIAGERNVTYDNTGGTNQEVQFYRNDAYDCGLTGKYTFMVLNPVNGDSQDEAPLWVYMHGGGSGYWDEEGNYFAVNQQTEDTWNHEEPPKTATLWTIP
jgi:hypothetical protein